MKQTGKRKPPTDAVEIIHRRYYGGRPQRMAELAEAEANNTVARKIYELRKRADLTQQQLAKLVGTTTAVISRLASALNKRVELRFIIEPCVSNRKPRLLKSQQESAFGAGDLSISSASVNNANRNTQTT